MPLVSSGKNSNRTIPAFSAAVAPSGSEVGGLCGLLALIGAESLTFGKAILRRRSRRKIYKFKKLIFNIYNNVIAKEIPLKSIRKFPVAPPAFAFGQESSVVSF